MRAILTALLLTVATQAGAECGNWCDEDWWKTATGVDVQAELDAGVGTMALRHENLQATVYASAVGTTTALQKLIDAGFDFNGRFEEGISPLIASLVSKTPANYELLTNAGAKSWNSNTLINGEPLFLVFFGEILALEIIPLWSIPVLLDKGANIDVRSEYGETPLSRAIGSWRIELVKLLVDLGANVNVRDESGNTLLHTTETVEIFQLLVSLNKVEIDARNLRGQTPLIYIAAQGSPELVQALVDLGANKKAKDINGSTAWDRAKLNEKLRMSDTYWELEVGSNSCGRLCDLKWWTYASEVNLQAQLKKGAFKKLTKEERENIWSLAQSSPLYRSAAYWALNEQRWN